MLRFQGARNGSWRVITYPRELVSALSTRVCRAFDDAMISCDLRALPSRVAHVADREQHLAEDDRDEDGEDAAGNQQALAESVTQARVASLDAPWRSGDLHIIVAISARIDGT